MNISAEYRQKFAFCILFLMEANLLFGTDFTAKQDTWISALISVFLLTLVGLLLWRISHLAPGKDLFDHLAETTAMIRAPICILLTVYCFSQGALAIRAYAGFVRIISLRNTDILILILLTGAAVFCFLIRDRSFLFRFSYGAALPIIAIVFLLFFLLFSRFRTELLFPVAHDNLRNIVIGAARNFAFPFGNAFLLLGISFYPSDKRKDLLSWILTMGTAGILTLSTVFQNLLLLGGELAERLDFPYIFSASLINVSDFFSRIEVFASLFFLLSTVIRTAYMMQLTAKGIQTVTKASGNGIMLSLTALLCFYSAISFENTNEIFHYLDIFPWIALPIQLGTPILLWIVLERRRLLRKRKNLFPVKTKSLQKRHQKRLDNLKKMCYNIQGKKPRGYGGIGRRVRFRF